MKPLKFESIGDVPADASPYEVSVTPQTPFAGQTFTCSNDVAEAFEVLSIKVGPFEQLAQTVEDGGSAVPFFALRGARLYLATVRPPDAIALIVRNVGTKPLRFTCELEPRKLP